MTGTEVALAIATLLLAAATALSVGAAFYLYRWRRILFRDGKYLVPEHFGDNIKDLAGQVDHLSQLTRQSHQNASKTSSEVNGLLDAMLTFQRALDERDQEIKRLKEGYDAELFRRFLRRFVIVDQVAADFEADEVPPTDTMRQIREYLKDAFEECGVEEFVPDLREDYRKATGISSSPKLVTTDDPALHYAIAEVFKPGYRLRDGQGANTIVPAKVAVYVPENAKQRE